MKRSFEPEKEQKSFIFKTPLPLSLPLSLPPCLYLISFPQLFSLFLPLFLLFPLPISSHLTNNFPSLSSSFPSLPSLSLLPSLPSLTLQSLPFPFLSFPYPTIPSLLFPSLPSSKPSLHSPYPSFILPSSASWSAGRKLTSLRYYSKDSNM